MSATTTCYYSAAINLLHSSLQQSQTQVLENTTLSQNELRCLKLKLHMPYK